MLLKVLLAVAAPLRLFTNLAFVVGGIWALVLREWDVLFAAIAASFCASFVLALALAPGLMLMLPAIRFLERGNKPLGYFFGWLSNFYTYSVMTLWCVGVLLIFFAMADGSSVVPTLLLSYGAATGAIEFMAQKEQEGEHELQVGSWAAAFFVRMGYVLMMLIVLTGRSTVVDVALAFGGVMAVCSMLQLLAARDHEPTESAGATV